LDPADRFPPMSPSNALLQAANTALADPNVRERVKQMHADGASLVQMVEALGLDRDLTARIRRILEDLPPDVVAGIRSATLEMLSGTKYAMPVICEMPDSALDAPVTVDVSPENGTPTIHVRPAAGP
jgi:hypothetical protein